ncbi:hypothetical protein [Romboutsia sp. Marseille-P6047]|uniref:hypothetical protein n=1 Tax=Romboutsia sp. Marseille-P6047 TaxID=2161817 RepID=UPI0013DD9609|nr:hypothetical protein [Romboutsia sp. Marseille-P6047]
MKLTENFITQDNPNLSNWGHARTTLKGTYKSEYCNEVKKYKLSKKELEVYLKDIDRK